jgi:hypothetical protein
LAGHDVTTIANVALRKHSSGCLYWKWSSSDRFGADLIREARSVAHLWSVLFGTSSALTLPQTTSGFDPAERKYDTAAVAKRGIVEVTIFLVRLHKRVVGRERSRYHAARDARMTIELIGAITLAFGIAGLFLAPSFIVYVFFGSTLLGAAGALILTSLGETNIQPAHLLLGFLAMTLMARPEIRDGAVRSVALGRPGFWLLVTMIYGAITAYLMPRFFAGDTLTFPVRIQGGLNQATPLLPTTSNLTQSIYFAGNFVCFFVLSGFASNPAGRNTLGRAALACVVLNLVFVALDLATFWTNTTELLSFIRNSTYSLMPDTELAGYKRIVGSFVEASSFSYWTLGYFAFALSLWLSGISPRLTLTLSLLSLLTLLFSTSTTAYVGLAAYLFAQYVMIVARLLMRPINSRTAFLVLGLPVLLSIVVVAILLNDTSAVYLGNLLDTLIFDKMSTDSGIERSTWNSQAIQNFFDTYGFGAGNGSVRASSFGIAVISSLGVIGSVTYSIFLYGIWSGGPPEDPVAAAMRTAARSACLAWLIAATASGAFIDLGLPFFAFAALACADPKTSEIMSTDQAGRSLQKHPHLGRAGL